MRQLRLIARAGSIVGKPEGAELVSEGKQAVAFFVVISGRVEIQRDGKPVAVLLSGDFFGEMALLADTTRSATATAASDVQLFALTAATFKKLLLEDSKIAYGVTRAIAARVTA
jgi:CRP-like cAMP-binding protein